jgi:uncharacterized membrane protein YhhN
MNLKVFTTIYFTISILEIIFGINHFQVGIYLTKPLIMISIIIFYFYQTQNQRNFQDKLMLIAFFFSMLGDTFLMFKGEKYFMFGLCSFLITHLFYIFVFSRNRLKVNLIARISLLIFSGIMLFVLQNHITNSLLIPIIIYMITITIMAMSASERNTNTESYRLVLIGAILFVLSDSLIAVDKFVMPIPFSTIFIMGTYVLAQYLICVGFLKRNTLTL